ncbi:MAG: prolipoprotein diacylglyceryl transferase [Planctomycetes bacterium]|nr:prolipoprotein diacylglyceryl transferase [Planctomycetota bacterium]
MHPYLIRLGGLSIPAYPVLYGLGITLGCSVLLLLAHHEGMSTRKLAHIILVLAFSCIVGGRTFYVLHHLSEFKGDWGKAFKLSYGGQVFYGGLLLGIPSVLVFCKLTKLPWNRVFDLAAVATPAGLALGRWACFCRGCCYGSITSLPWAIEFPKHVDIYGHIVGSPVYLRQLHQGSITQAASHSLPVHPAQIYSSALSLVVFAVMLWFWKAGRTQGQLVLVYLVLYAISRFILEFFRDNQMAFGGLTIAQVLSMIIGPLAASVLLVCRLRERKTRT